MLQRSATWNGRERGWQLPQLLSLDSEPAAAAVRYLPMCLLQSGGGGRGGPAPHVTSTSRAKEGPLHLARCGGSSARPQSASLPLAAPDAHQARPTAPRGGGEVRGWSQQGRCNRISHTRSYQGRTTHRIQDAHKSSVVAL